MRIKNFLKSKGVTKVTPEQQRFIAYGAIYDSHVQAARDTKMKMFPPAPATLPSAAGSGGGEAPGVTPVTDASGRRVPPGDKNQRRDAFGVKHDTSPSTSITQLRTGRFSSNMSDLSKPQNTKTVKIQPNQ